MGQSSSSGRRRNDYQQSYPPSSSSYPPPPPPPPASGFNPPTPNYIFAANAPYPSASRPNYGNPYSTPPPPPPPPPPAYNSYYSHQPTAGYGNLDRIFDSLMGRSRYTPYYGTNQGAGRWTSSSSSSSSSGWWPNASPASSSSTVVNPQPVPPFVEHQKAKTIKNDVNLHKDTIRLEKDEQNPDQYLVSFTFDALVDGSVTIYYFAKEGADCRFSSVHDHLYKPVRVDFQKGAGQKFSQPSGSGIDLGFFELDDLRKPLDGDVFPLVIYAEACASPQQTNEQAAKSTAAACAQITQAVIQKNNGGSFQVKVIRQILWVDGQRYELQEIFGLGSSGEAEPSIDTDDDIGKECVICLSEPRNTAVLPCRHMCMCSECAKAFRIQSSKCPICRQPVGQLLEIKVNSADQ